MKRPRSGIVGAGFMGSVHARAVRAAGRPAFSDGLRAARLTAAVLQSAASGDWQAVG